jgi:hypothetical protein
VKIVNLLRNRKFSQKFRNFPIDLIFFFFFFKSFPGERCARDKLESE